MRFKITSKSIYVKLEEWVQNQQAHTRSIIMKQKTNLITQAVRYVTAAKYNEAEQFDKAINQS